MAMSETNNTNLKINRVPTIEVLKDMIENNQIQPNQMYLIESTDNSENLSKNTISDLGGLVTPDVVPTSQVIPSIDTDNVQQNLTIGSGLSIVNNELTATGGSGGTEVVANPTNTYKWKLNATLPIEPNLLTKTYISFKSNNQDFVAIENKRFGGINHLIYYTTTSDFIVVYNTGDSIWSNQSYRTIEFLEEPTGNLLTWLQANGTEIENSTLKTLKIDNDIYNIQTPLYQHTIDVNDYANNKIVMVTPIKNPINNFNDFKVNYVKALSQQVYSYIDDLIIYTPISMYNVSTGIIEYYDNYRDEIVGLSTGSTFEDSVTLLNDTVYNG